MKRIFAIVFSVVFVFAAVVPAFAVSAATETETYTEYYGDGSYTVVTITATPVANAARAASQTTAGTKTTDYYDSADKLQWSAKVRGVFTYNGSTATCTSATVSHEIHSSKWKCHSELASKSGNTARGDFEFYLYTLALIHINTREAHPVLTCSASGDLS